MVSDDILNIMDILNILMLFTPSLLLVACMCMCVCVATRTDVGAEAAAAAAATNRRLRKSRGKYSPAWYYKTLETLETVSEVSGAEEAC
jgi:hypothetical protein